MGYCPLETDRDALPALKASFQGITVNHWDRALLFLLKNGDRACHGASAASLTNVRINSDFNYGCISSLHCNDDLAAGMAFIQIAEGFRSLIQRKGSVDDRRELACFDELF